MNQAPRLLPLVAFAALCLAALKLAGLMLGGGLVVSGVAPATAQSTSALPSPEALEPVKTDDAPPAPPPLQATAPAAPNVEAVGPKMSPTRTEMDVLESLAQRRKTLDQRERELLLRENLLRAAQSKVETRINELKAIEARIESNLKKEDEERKAQQGRLVQMYALMKPKDAAAILNRMNGDVLTALFMQMNPRVMSAILAEMDPVVAQRVTAELASKSLTAPADGAGDLPQIQSKGPG